jgi:hypothetical protein
MSPWATQGLPITVRFRSTGPQRRGALRLKATWTSPLPRASKSKRRAVAGSQPAASDIPRVPAASASRRAFQYRGDR